MRLADIEARHDRLQSAGEFVKFAKLLALSGGDPSTAIAIADADSTAPPRVSRVLKSAVAAGTTADANWAGNLLDHRVLVSAFQGTLAQSGIFDRLLANGMKRTPIRTRVGLVTTAIVGGEVGEGSYIPVSSLGFDAGEALDPRKVQALLVVTEELLRATGSAGEALLGAELRKAATAATDIATLAIILAAATVTPSSGTDSDAAIADIRTLLSGVATSATSKLFFVMNAANAKNASTLTGTAGARLFPDLGPLGGFILGVPVLLSDQAGGNVFLIDADQLAGDSDTITIDGSAQAALKMASDAPDGAGTHVSLWQTNSKALLATRWFGMRVVGTSAAAVLTDVDWGSVNGSDA